MPAQYIVTYGRGRELKPLNVFQNALSVALELDKHFAGTVGIVNQDNIDVCMDEDCKSCNRDGLTAEEREALSDAGLA